MTMAALFAAGNYLKDFTVDGVASVTAAGTRVQLSSTVTPCEAVVVQNLENSAGIAVVGEVGVVATAGTTRRGIVALAPGEATVIPCNELSILYVDATVATTNLSWCAMR
jgi:hypothetical protein